MHFEVEKLVFYIYIYRKSFLSYFSRRLNLPKKSIIELVCCNLHLYVQSAIFISFLGNLNLIVTTSVGLGLIDNDSEIAVLYNEFEQRITNLAPASQTTKHEIRKRKQANKDDEKSRQPDRRRERFKKGARNCENLSYKDQSPVQSKKVDNNKNDEMLYYDWEHIEEKLRDFETKRPAFVNIQTGHTLKKHVWQGTDDSNYQGTDLMQTKW